MAQYISGAGAINEQFYTDRRTSQKKLEQSGEAAGTDAGLFRDVLLDSPGTRNTIIGYRLEAHQWRRYNYLTLGPRT
jgi:hypothetical protein